MQDTISFRKKKLLNNLKSAWRLKLYFLLNLPSAFGWGLRITKLNPDNSEVVIPYNWRTKNPFQSIYFAALAGAGELSTGILAILALADRSDVSMLVVNQKAEFFKKANTKIHFRCEQGKEVMTTIERAVETEEPQTITMQSIGRNADNEEVCKVYITWSFKLRKK